MRQTGKNKPHMSVLARRKAKWGYVFLLPWLIMFLVFYAYPLFYGTAVSFTNFSLGKMSWVGVGNYVKIFQDYRFWRSLRGMLGYCIIIIPMQVFIPMWAANTIYPYKRGLNTASKLLVYMPGVTCSVALVLAWKFMLDPNLGFVSRFLKSVIDPHFTLFDNALHAIPALSLLIVLSNMGANLIIYSAALGNIPADFYEAAELDGASPGQQFRLITMPLLHPTIVYVFVTATIAALQVFIIPQLMTSGGPNYTTSTLLMLIYDSAFANNQFGYASALGVILFLITAVIAVVQFRITRRDTIEF